MNRFFVLAVVATVFLPLSAQQKAQIKVGYDYETSVGGKTVKADYILLAGQEGSEFYNPTTLWMDISSKDDAACQAYGIMATQMAEAGRSKDIPNRAESMYIFKDYGKQVKTVYDDYSDQYAVYTEPAAEMHWEVVPDSTKSVLGYECLMARTSYHGRDWTAWFAPEIPVQDGPWKLSGLPGLIMMATESAGIHSFTANGVEATDEVLPGMPRDDWYHKEGRIKYLRGKFRNLQDPLADLAGGNLPMNARVFVNGEETTREEVRRKAAKVLEAGYDFPETDYHK